MYTPLLPMMKMFLLWLGGIEDQGKYMYTPLLPMMKMFLLWLGGIEDQGHVHSLVAYDENVSPLAGWD